MSKKVSRFIIFLLLMLILLSACGKKPATPKKVFGPGSDSIFFFTGPNTSKDDKAVIGLFVENNFVKLITYKTVGELAKMEKVEMEKYIREEAKQLLDKSITHERLSKIYRENEKLSLNDIGELVDRISNLDKAPKLKDTIIKYGLITDNSGNNVVAEAIEIEYQQYIRVPDLPDTFDSKDNIGKIASLLEAEMEVIDNGLYGLFQDSKLDYTETIHEGKETILITGQTENPTTIYDKEFTGFQSIDGLKNLLERTDVSKSSKYELDDKNTEGVEMDPYWFNYDFKQRLEKEKSKIKPN